MDGLTLLAARATRLDSLAERPPEVLVVGGGITGAGIALDLALRGLDVALVERGDFAGATSSTSSRLIHGGLRYLEHFELGLVRESCLERARLLRLAAGFVWPERFVFPVRRGDRVGTLKLAAGLWLYTLLAAPHSLGRPRRLHPGAVGAALPAVDTGALAGGGTYLDAATHDARLTLAVLRTAEQVGARVLSRVDVESIERAASGARLAVTDRLAGGRREVEARCVVLAAGPFTDELRARAGLATGWLSPTRGAHVALPRERLPTDGAVIFPSPIDGRVMFLLPWPRATVIGTTDLDADPREPPRATAAEVRYLLDSANALCPAAALREGDVLSAWAGLRPLLAAPATDPSARPREERIEVASPFVTIAGGKLTGYRAMAERVGARVVDLLGRGIGGTKSPTRERRLHGALHSRAQRPAWSSLPVVQDEEALLRQALLRRHGAQADAVRKECGEERLDVETLAGEVEHAVRWEHALWPSDVMLRRTDCGYRGRAEADDIAERVVTRMAAVLGWDEGRREAARREWHAARDGMEAWRGAG